MHSVDESFVRIDEYVESPKSRIKSFLIVAEIVCLKPLTESEEVFGRFTDETKKSRDFKSLVTFQAQITFQSIVLLTNRRHS